jgi:regulator of replication initiation timing
VLPKLQINSMKTRVNKAADIYKDNLRLYQRLMKTKSTIPTVEELKVINLEKDRLKQRISQYDIVVDNNNTGFQVFEQGNGINV